MKTKNIVTSAGAGNELIQGPADSSYPVPGTSSDEVVFPRDPEVIVGPGCPMFLRRKLRSIIENHIPVGYQNQTGFHFGIQPFSDDGWGAFGDDRIASAF